MTAGDWQALAASLGRRFAVVEQTIEAAGRPFALIKPRSSDELISEDDFNRDARLPYWADVWPSALCLAERTARIRGAGKRLIELGCGVGLVCAVAAQRGFEVLATDYYAEALEFTEVNRARNGLPPIATRLIDWRNLPSDLGTFDVVAAADVLYEKAYPALIAAAIEHTLAADGLALVADPGRPGAARFHDECRSRGLAIERVLQAPFDNGTVPHTVDLYEIKRA
ncbi:MAG TPA: methyltransferase domain-containing protein [Pirellulales bacterium]|nr:methyltransferase domain-containing protein [Pirellulales bacterium]